MNPALADYERKRNFRSTPEPRGGKRAKAAELGFVVQKHAARRLHYDFRLELDGTLKSWAVPNGPTNEAGVKRLAVHVEDHPLDYAHFEGVIPKGHYGAGTVEIWDQGTWRPTADPRKGYRKGHLEFELEGKRLHGAWDLVRMRRKEGEKGDNWLLISRNEISTKKSTPREKSSLPKTLSPQLATLVETAPSGDDWVYEIKYDGYRMLARIADGKVTLFSRNGKDWTERFARQAKALAALPLDQAWLDGEMAVFEPDGSTSFQKLQNALDTGGKSVARVKTEVRFALFDLLHLDGEDLREQPLLERKAKLQALLAKKPSPLLLYSEHLEADGKAAHEHACEHGLEGVIGKRRDAPYVHSRSRDWIKLKCRKGQELVIGGYTDPRGGRSGFGALLMGVREGDGTLRYAGKVGTGFDDRMLAAMRKRLERLARKESPFAGAVPGPKKGVHWVKPELVADIAFHGWTDEGVMRHAAFVALREDKPAREVRREKPAPAKSTKPAKPEKDNVVAGMTITHPERMLYPALKATKLDLARYYESVAEWILPHLKDRPLSLVRCPQGPAHKCFFQRNAHQSMPKRGAFIVADTPKTLLQLVQNGVIELHTWGSRAKKPMVPDRFILDLDPDQGLPWARVVEGAQLVRTLLDELKLESFLKTTGGKGLHLVVPVKPELNWVLVKNFTHRIADHLAATLPGLFTAKISKAARKGKIFVDYLRNQEGATAVAAFSVRAREGATVSVPLAWDELDADLDPAQFDIRTITARLNSLSEDPWKGYAERQSLPAAIERMP